MSIIVWLGFMFGAEPAAAESVGKFAVSERVPRTSTQSFSGVFGGETLIENEQDDLVASIFSVSYLDNTRTVRTAERSR